MTEGDYFINTVNKLGTKECRKRFLCSILRNKLALICKSGDRRRTLATCVGCHYNDSIFKINLSALCIGNLTVIKNLKKNIKHIGMRLFDLIKQNNRIRATANLLSKLTCLIISNVSGRRSNDSRNRMLLHKLRHIKSDKRLRLLEKILCKNLNKLCLTDTCRTCKNHRNRILSV